MILSTTSLSRFTGLGILVLYCFVNISLITKIAGSPIVKININNVKTRSAIVDVKRETKTTEEVSQAQVDLSPAEQSNTVRSVECNEDSSPFDSQQESSHETQTIEGQEDQENDETAPPALVLQTPETASPEENVNQTVGAVCQSKHCYSVAESIRDALDTSVDPCDNFYEYACGSWIEKNKVPKTSLQYSRIQELNNNNERVMIESLNKTEPTDEPNLKKAKTFFQTCQDEEAIDSLGSKPLHDLIKDLGYWALDKEWNATAWDFNATVAKAHRDFPVEVFFNVEVTPDPTQKDKATQENIIKIDQSSLTLPQSIYLCALGNKTNSLWCLLSQTTRTDARKVFKRAAKYTEDVLTAAGYEKKEASKWAKKIIIFEAQIATHLVPPLFKKQYAKTNISELEELLPYHWLKHMKSLFAPRPVTKDTRVIVLANDYLPGLFKLLKNKEEKEKELLSMYVGWRVVKELVPFLSTNFRKIHSNLKKQVMGRPKPDIPRTKKCYMYTNQMLAPLVGALFIRKAFNPDSKKKVETMMKGIIKAFEERMDEVEWIDNKTDSAVQEKADAAVCKIGYPEYLKDEKRFHTRYQMLNVTDTNSWFQNVLESCKMAASQIYQKLGTFDDKEEWIIDLQMVNAVYVVTSNEIVIPAGILQPPFFYGDVIPRSISYGAIGHVMGHEFTHGFDTVGRLYNKDGNELETNSWSNSSTKTFHDRADCLVKQFNNFTVGGNEHVDGEKTLSENIADAGGVQLAYKAFQQFVKVNGPEEVLPLINMPSEKLFFLGFAQKMCVHSTKKSLRIQVAKDEHAPSNFRVIGTLANSQEFADVYKCPVGSKMNPKKKCEVW